MLKHLTLLTVLFLSYYLMYISVALTHFHPACLFVSQAEVYAHTHWIPKCQWSAIRNSGLRQIETGHSSLTKLPCVTGFQLVFKVVSRFTVCSAKNIENTHFNISGHFGGDEEGTVEAERRTY